MQKVITVTLASAVATAGTFTATYPAGSTAGSFAPFGHYIFVRNLQSQFSQDAGTISVTFGAAAATITYKGATTIPAGSVVSVNLNILGDTSAEPLAGVKRTVAQPTLRLDLGAPATAVTNGISASQSVAAAGSFLLNGSLLNTDSKMILDVPRNVVGAWTGTSVLTITGYDEYGKLMIEQSASGATHAGKKAFKEITSVASGGAITAATLGTGDVLGLPTYFSGTWQLIKELEDNAVATAGTLVAGVQTTPTATTGDIRGTYDPASAANGTKFFSLFVALGEPNYLGVDQYDG